MTPEEGKAIAMLKQVAKIWPKTLWLFSASGTLNVMRTDEDGDRVYIPIEPGRGGGGVDPAYNVATISIPNDGGDW